MLYGNDPHWAKYGWLDTALCSDNNYPILKIQKVLESAQSVESIGRQFSSDTNNKNSAMRRRWMVFFSHQCSSNHLPSTHRQIFIVEVEWKLYAPFNFTARVDSDSFFFIFEIGPFWGKLSKDKVEIDKLSAQALCLTELMSKSWVWHFLWMLICSKIYDPVKKAVVCDARSAPPLSNLMFI